VPVAVKQSIISVPSFVNDTPFSTGEFPAVFGSSVEVAVEASVTAPVPAIVPTVQVSPVSTVVGPAVLNVAPLTSRVPITVALVVLARVKAPAVALSVAAGACSDPAASAEVMLTCWAAETQATSEVPGSAPVDQFPAAPQSPPDAPTQSSVHDGAGEGSSRLVVADVATADP
jgi:hypothetical protein